MYNFCLNLLLVYYSTEKLRKLTTFYEKKTDKAFFYQKIKEFIVFWNDKYKKKHQLKVGVSYITILLIYIDLKILLIGMAIPCFSTTLLSVTAQTVVSTTFLD